MNLESLLLRGSALWETASPHIKKLFGKMAGGNKVAISSARMVIFAYTIVLLALPAILSFPAAWLSSICFVLYLWTAAAINFFHRDGMAGAQNYAWFGFTMFACLTLPIPFINIRVLSFLSVVGLSSAYVSLRAKCESFDVNEFSTFVDVAQGVQFDNFVSAGKAIISGADFAAS